MHTNTKRLFLRQPGILTIICATTIVFTSCSCGTEDHTPHSETDDAALHEIRRLGGTVFSQDNWDERTITLGPDWKGGAAGLALLDRLQCVGELVVAYPEFDDRALADVLTLPNLSGLRLRHTQVTPQGLLALKQAADLTLLEIEDQPVTNALLQSIKDVDLRILILHGSSDISDSGLEVLRSMSNLITLRLPGAKITAEGFAKLDSLKEIREIVLANTLLEDRALRHFTPYKKLNRLDLSGTRIRGSGLKSLEGCSRLRELVLNDTAVGDDGLRGLAELCRLQALSLDRTPITDEGIAFLAKLTALRTLSVRQTRVSEEGLRQLSKLPKLVTVRVKDGDVVLFQEAWVERPRLAYAVKEQGKKLFLWTDGGLRQLQYVPPD